MAANSAALHRYQQRNIFLMVKGHWSKKNTKQGGDKLIGIDQAWDILEYRKSFEIRVEKPLFFSFFFFFHLEFSVGKRLNSFKDK